MSGYSRSGYDATASHPRPQAPRGSSWCQTPSARNFVHLRRIVNVQVKRGGGRGTRTLPNGLYGRKRKDIDRPLATTTSDFPVLIGTADTDGNSLIPGKVENRWKAVQRATARIGVPTDLTHLGA